MSVMSVISVLMEIVVLLAVICAKSPCVRSGIRTHAYISRLRPERSALDHSAILTRGGQNYWTKWWYQLFSPFSTGKTRLIVVGFEPTPPKWLVPKTSALDHSATLPYHFIIKRKKTAPGLLLLRYWNFQYLNTVWQRWDSNPRHRSDWCLKPAP